MMKTIATLVVAAIIVDLTLKLAGWSLAYATPKVSGLFSRGMSLQD